MKVTKLLPFMMMFGVGCNGISDDTAEKIRDAHTGTDLVATQILDTDEFSGIVNGTSLTLNLDVQIDEDADHLSLDHFECSLNLADFTPCEAEITIEDLTDGSTYLFRAQAHMLDSVTGATVAAVLAELSWKVKLGSSDDPVVDPDAPAVSALATELQVGDFYLASVPDSMHITEYSTSKTTGVLSFYRIMNESDPNYLGNFRCDQVWDRQVSAFSPAGEQLNYCHSTPTRASYRFTNEFRLANNHIEVATDAKDVTDTNNERISVSVYDSDYEFMTDRSRFKNLCDNRERRYIDVPMLNNFFLGTNPETVRFWYCDTTIPAQDGSVQFWKVGTFIEVDNFDWNCAECSYPRAVEVVYMMRPEQQYMQPARFARLAQERILGMLTKVAP